MRAWAIVAGMLAIAISMGVSAKIYKWVDEEGQIHYGQQPPHGVDAEPMSVHSAPASSSSSSGSSGSSTSSSPKSADRGSGSGSGEQQAGANDAITENCKIARQNLSVLEASGPDAQFRQPDGEVKKYTEEQWQARVDQNRQYIDNFCQEQ